MFACFSWHVTLACCGLAGGQRHVPHPSGQEPDERGGANRQGLLRGLHQVPEVAGHGVAQPARRLLEDEGAREETPGQEGETRRNPNQDQESVPEKTR